MGNCMETKRGKERSEECKGVKVINRFVMDESDGLFNKISENGHMRRNDSKSNGGGVRVKVVVTKEELQWLVSRLSSTDNGSDGGVSHSKRSIEDVLSEFGNNGRKRLHGWKPSLDSIPEVLETNI